MTDEDSASRHTADGRRLEAMVGAPAGSEPSVRLLAACVLAFLAYPVWTLADGGFGSVAMTFTSAAVAVVVVLYLWALWHRGAQLRWRVGALVAMTALGVAVPALWGATWVGMLLFPALCAPIVLHGWRGIAVALGLGATVLGEGTALGASSDMVLSLTLVIILGGLVFGAYLRLVEVNGLLVSARAEVARLAASEERRRLAWDLHDEVKQELFVASVELGTVRGGLDGDSGLEEHVQAASLAVARAKEELTEMIRAARPAGSVPVELTDTLRSKATRWSQRYEIPIEVEGSLREDVPGTVGEALIRATGEALLNVARHADARRVHVRLVGDDRGLEIRVADDGRGIGPQPTPGQGLAVMAERLGAVGATVEIHSCPGAGTELVMRWRTAETAGAGR